MKEKKQIKRLKLKKEEIVNLNEFQMNQIKGGATPSIVWSVIKSVIESVASAYSIYTAGKEESLWNCAESAQADCMTDISKQYVASGCLIPDVDVYGIYTYKG